MNPQVEKFLKLPLYQRALILVGFNAAILGACIYFIFLPQYKEYTTLVTKHQQVRDQLAKDQKIADNLPKFKAEYEKMNERLAQALTELPNAKEIPALLTNIASLARDNGLEVLQFKPGADAVKGFYADVPVGLKVVGNYHQVAKFFFDVGSLPRIVNIGSVTIGGAKIENNRLQLTVECLATTFRFVDEKQPQPAKGQAKQ